MEEPLPDPVRRALLRTHARGARLIAIWTGVFALARTGLLDGRPTTMHWSHAGRLRLEFSRVRGTGQALRGPR